MCRGCRALAGRACRAIPHTPPSAPLSHMQRAFLCVAGAGLQHLPQRFRATSGILIDSENRRSRQTDVIVYDALSSPIYRASERLQILPAHTTAAIVEVKSELTPATLRDGYEKISLPVIDSRKALFA